MRRVHGPALGLDHGFVRHPLQQGVPEFVADLRTDIAAAAGSPLRPALPAAREPAASSLSRVSRKSSVKEPPMQAAAWAMRRAPGRRSRRSDINSASMSGTPPSRRCGAGPRDCSSSREMTSCSRKNGTPSAASTAFATISSDSAPAPGTDRASSRQSCNPRCSRRTVSSIPGSAGPLGKGRIVNTTRTGNFAEAVTMSCSSSADEGSSQCASSIQRITGRARAACSTIETMNSILLRA